MRGARGGAAAGQQRGSRRSWRSPCAGPRVLAAAALGALLVTGPQVRADASALIVAVATSLREPVQEISADYEALYPGRRVRLSFGASSALAMQIRHGAPIQLFLSADPSLIDELARRGRVAPGERFAFASNRLVVMLRPGLELPITSARDLLAAQIERIALPPPAVPLGRYAREWLEAQGLLAALLPRIVTTEHARATLVAVDNAHADVAVVYATDARIARAASLAYEIPSAQQPVIVYTAARIETGGPDSAAADYLALLREAPAAAHLRAAGFEPAAALTLPASNAAQTAETVP